MSIVAQWIIAVVVLVAVAIIAVFIIRGRQAKKRAAQASRAAAAQQREEEYTRRKTTGRQQTIGGTLFNAFTAAARKNLISNMLPSGECSSTIHPIEVTRIPNNNRSYSIIVFMLDDGSMRGSAPILQFDVDLFEADPQKRLHVFHCPYGKDHYFREEEADAMMVKYAQFIEHFSLFPATMESHLAKLGIKLQVTR